MFPETINGRNMRRHFRESRMLVEKQVHDTDRFRRGEVMVRTTDRIHCADHLLVFVGKAGVVNKRVDGFIDLGVCGLGRQAACDGQALNKFTTFSLRPFPPCDREFGRGCTRISTPSREARPPPP